MMKEKKSFILLTLVVLWLIALPVKAQTERMTVNDGWRFFKGDIPAASAANFQDADWEKVNLPHTWNTDAYTVRNYYQGIGWYRKNLQIPQRWQGKRLYLHFEGANKVATVYLNGKMLGEHLGGYTYFNYDITDVVNANGNNTLAVKVDNARMDATPQSGDFTFMGGIYRDVWLIAANPVHFDLTNKASDGIFVTTPQVSETNATVSVRGILKNETNVKQNLELEVALYCPHGSLKDSQKQRIQLKPGEDFNFQLLNKLAEDVHLWSPEDPKLYQVKATVRDRKTGAVLDERTVHTAFRWYSFDADKGFTLNGKPYKLRGVCRHQDQAPVGYALSDEMHRRDMLLMKEMGTNFIRISHYPQDEAILEMCDKLGILAWEEIPIINAVPANSPGYEDSCEENLREMIRQHYNHPSVILWGYMNEIMLMAQYIRYTDEEQKQLNERTLGLANRLEKVLKEEDSTRLSTMAFHGNNSYNEIGISEVTDVVGWNIYNGWYGANLADFDQWMADQHRDHPTHPMIVSEYGAGSDKRLHTLAEEIQDFSIEYQQTYIEHYIPVIENTPYIMGGSYWNFIDFSSASRAEATPRINNKGLTYNNRTPKDVFYYLKAYWRSDIPVLHIATRDWNVRSGVQQGDAPVVQPVKVYTNLPSVELLMNGKSLGSKRVENFFAIFDVPFESGEPVLTARGTWQGKQVEDAIKIQFTAFPAQITGKNVKGLELGVNVGSNCFFISDVSNFTWLPDQPYTEGGWGYLGGNTKRVTTEIAATHDGPLFQTQRTGIEGYRFDVPKGTYEVELLFADLSGADRRAAYQLSSDTQGTNGNAVLGISINGQTVDAISPKTDNGVFTALRKKYIVQNTTDHVEVCFDASNGEAFLNGIKIRKIEN